jgi:hypothetical protein
VPRLEDVTQRLFASVIDGVPDPGSVIDTSNTTFIPHNLAWDTSLSRFDYEAVGGYLGYYEDIGDSTGLSGFVGGGTRDAPAEPRDVRSGTRTRTEAGSLDVHETKTPTLGSVNLALVQEIEKLRARAGEISEAEWYAMLDAAYGADSRDVTLIGQAIAKRAGRSDGNGRGAAAMSTRDLGPQYCEAAHHPTCPIKDCTIVPLAPTECDRYPLPDDPYVPCTRRENVCELSFEDPCQTYLAPYQVAPLDPMADYEDTFGESPFRGRTEPNGKEEEDHASKLPSLRQVLRAIAGARHDLADQRGGVDPLDELLGRLKQTMEISTCLMQPWSAACERVALAIERDPAPLSRDASTSDRLARLMDVRRQASAVRVRRSVFRFAGSLTFCTASTRRRARRAWRWTGCRPTAPPAATSYATTISTPG